MKHCKYCHQWLNCPILRVTHLRQYTYTIMRWHISTLWNRCTIRGSIIFVDRKGEERQDSLQYMEDIMAHLFKFFFIKISRCLDIQALYLGINKVLRFQNHQLFWNLTILSNSMAILAKKTEFVKISHYQELVHLRPLSLI